jgi:NADH dehydrogenase
VFSFRELMELVLKQIGRSRFLLPLPWPLARLIGIGGDIAASLLPFAPPLTSDQVELLKNDNVCDEELPGLAALGVRPTAVEAVIPSYLHRYRRGGQFAEEAAAAPGV